MINAFKVLLTDTNIVVLISVLVIFMICAMFIIKLIERSIEQRESDDYITYEENDMYEFVKYLACGKKRK